MKTITEIIDALELEQEDGHLIDENEIKLIIQVNMDKLVKEIKDELRDR